jgi:hypothetical protein
MRATPKLFQPWSDPFFSIHPSVSKSAIGNGAHAMLVIVMTLSTGACLVGAWLLFIHWNQVVRTPLPIHMAGDAVLRTDTLEVAPVPASQKADISISTNTPAPNTNAASQVATTSNGISASGNTTVTVNGENIPVPANGTISRSIVSNDSNTSVQVSSGSSSNSVSSSVNVQVTSGTSNGGNP